MSPKEKAKELFAKMYNVDDPMGSYPMCFDTAKECALIAADEVLGYMGADRGTEFWLEVKSEIEKL